MPGPRKVIGTSYVTHEGSRIGQLAHLLALLANLREFAFYALG